MSTTTHKRHAPESPPPELEDPIDSQIAKKPRRSGRLQQSQREEEPTVQAKPRPKAKKNAAKKSAEPEPAPVPEPEAEAEPEVIPASPVKPLIKDGLPTPNPDSHSTRTAEASFAETADRDTPISSPPSPTSGFQQEATQSTFEATQLASQFVQPREDGPDVWGYLIPIDMDKSYGDVLTLKKRSSCDGNHAGKPCPSVRGGDRKACAHETKGSPSGYLIGRHAECDLRLEQPTVSNRHCVIFKETLGSTPKAILEDLSANGTFVRGAMVGRNNRRELHTGDEIKLVDGARFMFRYPTQQATGSFSDLFEIPANGALGSGHFATVHIGIEKSTGNKYAVKVFKKRRKDDGRGQLGLEQEIAVLMSVHHPHVLCLKETYDEEDGIYLVLELASEGELFNLIIERGKLSEADTRKVYIQLLNGLKYLHERNIVHRDIKPENILLTDKNLTCKLADFGLAKIIGEDSFTTSLCGTPSYVAPEILMPSRNRKYTRAVDIWSLGVVLYICLCGFPPFSDELAPPSLREQIKEGRFDYPSPYWDSIGDSALDLIDRMLTVDPEARITVEEALEHPWIRNAPFNPAQSTDSDASLAGHMESLKVRRVVGRERTLIAEQVKGEMSIDDLKKGKPEVLNGTKPALREVVGEKDAFMKLGGGGMEEALYKQETL